MKNCRTISLAVIFLSCIPACDRNAGETTETPRTAASETESAKDIATISKVSRPTGIDGVYVISTDESHSILDAYGIENTRLMEILSDKPIEFALTTKDQSPDWHTYPVLASDRIAETYQYFVRLVRSNENSVWKSSCYVRAVLGEEVKLDDALKMKPTDWITAKGSGGFVSWTRKHKLSPQVETEKIDPPKDDVLSIGLQGRKTTTDSLRHSDVTFSNRGSYAESWGPEANDAGVVSLWRWGKPDKSFELSLDIRVAESAL